MRSSKSRDEEFSEDPCRDHVPVNVLNKVTSMELDRDSNMFTKSCLR